MGAQQHWSTTPSTNATADTQVNLQENQAPSTLNDAVRAVMAQMKKTIGDFAGSLVTTGSATAFAVASNEVITALSDGLMVRARAHTASGSAPTLALDSTAAKAIKLAVGVAPHIGAMISGGIYTFTYYSADDVWILSGGPAINKFVGETITWNGTGLPPLCLWEDGSAVSRTTYAALFAAIGTTYGTGDGSTTFNVPDSRGRVDAGQDDMGGTSANRLTNQSGGLNGDTLGATGGSETHASGGAESGQKAISAAPVAISDPGHDHTLPNLPQSSQAVASGAGATVATGTFSSGLETGAAVTGITATFTLAASSAGSAHNNVQPTIVKNKVIFAGV